MMVISPCWDRQGWSEFKEDVKETMALRSISLESLGFKNIELFLKLATLDIIRRISGFFGIPGRADHSRPRTIAPYCFPEPLPQSPPFLIASPTTRPKPYPLLALHLYPASDLSVTDFVTFGPQSLPEVSCHL